MNIVVSAASRPQVWTVDDEGDVHFITPASQGWGKYQWDNYFECFGCCLSEEDFCVFLGLAGAATKGVAYHVVIRPAKNILAGSERTIQEVRATATKKGWQKANWEVGCLIRSPFFDERQWERLGFRSIVMMHEPLKPYQGEFLMRLDRPNIYNSPNWNCRWMHAHPTAPWHECRPDEGYAFIVPTSSVYTLFRSVGTGLF